MGGNDAGEFFFDLATDPAERNNLIKSQSEAAGKLEALLETWEADVTPERR